VIAVFPFVSVHFRTFPAGGILKISGIQIARGVAALAVVGCHALPNFAVGGAGVDLFFVISGFVMVHSSERLFGRDGAVQEFLWRRIIRIVPLYWTTTTILLAYILVHYRGLAAANLSIEAVAASYFFIPYPQLNGVIPVHSVGWTLNFEMFFYVCFAASLSFDKRLSVPLLLVGLCVFVVCGPLAPFPLSYLASPLVLEFAFGAAIALVAKSHARIPSFLSAAIILLSGAALLCSSYWPHVPRIAAWGLPSAAIIAAIALANSQANAGKTLRPMLLLGDASYALYLTHPLVISIPKHLAAVSPLEKSAPYLYGASLSAAAVAVAIIVHLACEKPATRFLRKLTPVDHTPGRREADSAPTPIPAGAGGDFG
jgi:exopolysaccharide production protein ExoZ